MEMERAGGRGWLCFGGLERTGLRADNGDLDGVGRRLGGDNISYSDPNNWDIQLVPVNTGGTTYVVVIPSSVTVNFDVPDPSLGVANEVFQITLGSSSTLRVNTGRNLKVLDEAAISGLVITDNGTFVSQHASANFAGNAAQMDASGGGTIDFAATSYSSASNIFTSTLLRANGAGTLLDLSSLQTLDANFDRFSGVQVHTVEASNSGVIDLSNVLSMQAPVREGTDRLDINVNTAGNIRLDSLQSTSGVGQVRFNVDVGDGITPYSLPAFSSAGSALFNVSANRHVTLGALLTHNGGGYTLGDNSNVTANALTSLTNAAVTIGNNATLSAPNVDDISDTSVSLAPGQTFTTGTIQTINGALLSVSGGVTFGTAFGNVSATSYSSAANFNTVTLLSADGTGSLLDLSSVTDFSAAFDRFSGVQVHTVSATNGGKVDLSGVQSIAAPVREGNDRLDFVVSGDGVLDLSALVSIDGVGQTRFDIDVGDGTTPFSLPAVQSAGNTQFDVSAARVVEVNALVSHDRGGYDLGDNASVTANALTSLTNATITLGSGATLAAPNLSDVTNSSINLTPGRTLTTGLLGTIDGAQLSVSGGVQFGTAFSNVSATSYSSAGLINSTTLLSADGAGSVLDLSSLTSFSATFDRFSGVQVHTVSATNGGKVDLSGVQTIAAPVRETSDRLDFVVSGGGVLDLSSLTSIDGVGQTRFDIDVGNGTTPATLTALQSAGNTQFDVSAARVVELNALVSHDRGGYTLGANATVTANALASLTNATLTLGSGSTFTAPSLTDVTNTSITLVPGQTLTTGPLGSIGGAMFNVSGGVKFGTSFGNLSATSYSSAGNINTATLLSADGTGTELDLSSVTDFSAAFDRFSGVQVHTVTVTNDARIDLSSVQTITGPFRETGDRLDFLAQSGGVIDLSSLQMVTSNAGRIRFTVEGGGQMVFGDVTISERMDVSVTDNTSFVDVTGNLHLDSTSTLSVTAGASVQIGGHYSFDLTDEAAFNADTAIFHFDGTPNQLMEVGGEDLGLGGALSGNFGIARLLVGSELEASKVILVDFIDNGNRASLEALYLYGSGGLDGLGLLGGSSLVIGNINVYAHINGVMVELHSLFGPGETTVPYDQGANSGFIIIPEPGVAMLMGLSLLGFARRRRRSR